MSREMSIKLNQILYQRSKDWLEKRPNTGILKFLDGRAHKKEDKESFDDYLRDHIKTSNKSINIRGLFRVPDVSQGEQLMIHVDEREEEEKDNIPTVEEIPRRHYQRRVQSDQGREIPISEIEMSKPMEIPAQEEILQKQMDEFQSEEFKKELREGVQEYARLSREERYRSRYDISEDDKQYIIEKKPKSFEDYLQQVRDSGGVLAVMNPVTGIPSFVLSYEKDYIKFYPYFSKYISKFYDFDPNKDPRKFADQVIGGRRRGITTEGEKGSSE